jgi:hypothetical protein
VRASIRFPCPALESHWWEVRSKDIIDLTMPSDAWSDAILEATDCLRRQAFDRLDACLAYLNELETILTTNTVDDDWNLPPTSRPPFFSETFQETPKSAGTTMTTTADLLAGMYDDNEAGDFPTLNSQSSMDCRRLLIRIVTFQSEVFACKAMSLCQSKEWQVGAEHAQSSLTKIHSALGIADSEISKWIQEDNHSVKKKELEQDAHIVSVAIESLTHNRDRCVTMCAKEESFLLRKLKPQWESRDEVKNRMGEDRWKNNPNRKNDHAELRREWEERLANVQGALEALRSLDTDEAHQKSMELQGQIDHGSGGRGDGINYHMMQQQEQLRRYNYQRPSYDVLQKRVGWNLYPDATEFGWTFTGSWDVTEFFEKENVKLDWYFTTATVKTSLDHPTQGKTQLFGNQVDPQQYLDILQNPRAHTGHRYHTTNDNKNQKATWKN